MAVTLGEYVYTGLLVKCDLCGHEIAPTQRQAGILIDGKWRPLEIDICQRCGMSIEKAVKYGVVSLEIEWYWREPMHDLIPREQGG